MHDISASDAVTRWMSIVFMLALKRFFTRVVHLAVKSDDAFPWCTFAITAVDNLLTPTHSKQSSLTHMHGTHSTSQSSLTHVHGTHSTSQSSLTHVHGTNSTSQLLLTHVRGTHSTSQSSLTHVRGAHSTSQSLTSVLPCSDRRGSACV